MRSRMTAEQLDRMKGKSDTANKARDLARRANGLGTTSSDARRADRELTETYGKRGAARLKEDALRQAGARPKFFSRDRWLG